MLFYVKILPKMKKDILFKSLNKNKKILEESFQLNNITQYLSAYSAILKAFIVIIFIENSISSF